MAASGPTKILLMHSTLAEIGGAETNFWAEVRGMRARGHEVEVFGFTNPTEPDPVEDPASHVCQEPTSQLGRWLAKFTFNVPAYRAIRRVLREFRPDVVHLHMNVKYPVAVLMALRDQHVVQSLHSGGMFCPSGWLIRADDMEVCEGGAGLKCVQHGCISAARLPIHMAMEPVWRGLARRIVGVYTPPSKHLAEMLKSFGFSRVSRLPYFSPVEMGEPRPPSSNHQVLFVGVVIESKGVASLIEAMPKVCEQVPDAKLVVVGDGDRLEACQELARSLGVESSVDFKGRLPNHELAALYSQAQVCAIPSIWLENSPLVAYEAMAAGRPIVGSDRGGIPDLIRTGNCGIVHAAKDSQQIADGIIKLFLDPSLAQELGANGRRYTEEKLTEAAFCEHVERLFGELRGEPVA